MPLKKLSNETTLPTIIMKNKKVGIITLFGYSNYGNRLQMFASQTVFRALGFDCEIIKFKEEEYKEPFHQKIKIFIKSALSPVRNIRIIYLNYCRVRSFKKNANELFCESCSYVDPESINGDFHLPYSFLSVGSDQIWGQFDRISFDFIFLRFAPVEKRITFSPSFGRGYIDGKLNDVFAEGIKGINNVSVRERSGATIVKELTGKDVTVLCDPTMCLTKEEWLEFSRRHRGKPDKKYILTYFLGSRPPKVNDILDKHSDQFEVVNLNSFDSPEFYAVNPSEWVDYINDATLFLTDSFHGVAFAILMQTPFSVYGRIGGESMQTRITNILEKFELEDRYDVDPNDELLFDLDFLSTEKILVSEREKALAFLKNALGIDI